MKPKTFSIEADGIVSDIVVGRALADFPASLAERASAPARVIVIADRHVPSSVRRPLVAGLKDAGFSAEILVLPPGEKSKSLAQAGRLYRQLSKLGIDRRSWLIGLGGGVTGDLTGFVAATYLRGLSFALVPTTLLAQVDAAIGGKTAVDLPEGKNLVGAFYHPRLTWIDPAVLKTLPVEHWRNGAAEVIKYGAILDAALFKTLEEKMPALIRGWSPDWAPIIARCAQLKAQIVQEDPRERSGQRALLNFGHTVGHAVEAAGGFRDYLHGEAISIGMFVAGNLSGTLTGLPDLDRIRLGTLLTTAGLPAQVRKPIARDALMGFLARDKKASQGSVKFVLLKALGKAVSGCDVPEDVLDLALRTSAL